MAARNYSLSLIKVMARYTNPVQSNPGLVVALVCGFFGCGLPLGVVDPVPITPQADAIEQRGNASVELARRVMSRPTTFLAGSSTYEIQ